MLVTPETETSAALTKTQPESLETPALTATGEVVISFDYKKQSGSASNQFALWIEDMDGKYINTLYATRYTANGGYKVRPDSIALWVDKSGLTNMEKAEVDAVSGATPAAGNLTYIWDLTDKNGERVQTGNYKFFVEGTLRWKNYVLYTGVITIGDTPAEVTADVHFVYEAADRQPALTGDSAENTMIGAVTAYFAPDGAGN
jgi:hypothetical protein